jgi:DNA-directed RNA polymerase alpha subunit
MEKKYPRISEEARYAIYKGIKRGDCICELELLGLNERIVATLEKEGFLLLEDLLRCNREDITSIRNLGNTSLWGIFDSLSRYHHLNFTPNK